MTDDDREKWERVKADHHAGVPLKEIIARHGIKPVDFFRQAQAGGWLQKPVSDGAQTTAAAPAAETSASTTDDALAWEDASYAYRCGLSITDIIVVTRLDPTKLLDRAMRENWRPDFGLMLAERYRPGEPIDELVKKVDAVFQGDSPAVTSVHRCSECGGVVKRPVYCGDACRQKAYRGRKRKRSKETDPASS